jgi:hypothetical protein
MEKIKDTTIFNILYENKYLNNEIIVNKNLCLNKKQRI